jgi:hypothetical protein
MSARLVLLALLVASPLRAQEELPPPLPSSQDTAAPMEEHSATPDTPAAEEQPVETPAVVPTLPTERAPPIPLLQKTNLLDLALLMGATVVPGMVGAAVGLGVGLVLAAAVAIPSALAVRFGRLSPENSSTGIALFLYVPPLVLGASVLMGYLLGRVVTPWVAPRLLGPRTKGTAGLARFGAVFTGVDVAAHLLLVLPLAAGVAGLALVTGWVASINNTNTNLLASPPRGAQVGYYVGAAYAAAALVVLLPPLAVLVLGGVPVASVFLNAATQSRGAP